MSGGTHTSNTEAPAQCEGSASPRAESQADTSSQGGPDRERGEQEATFKALREERDRLAAELVVAKQHKVLSLLGKSSWQEVVEDKLRVELAEAQVALDALRAREGRLIAYVQHKAECETQAKWNLNDAASVAMHLAAKCTCGLAAILREEG